VNIKENIKYATEP